MRRIIVSTLTIFSFLTLAAPTYACGVSGGSACLVKTVSEDKSFDYRVVQLQRYFESHNSPLADHSETFVDYADNHNVDWRLVPAIAGVESTFGKRVPSNSFNAYGWANGAYKFQSWEHSIGVVTKTLDEKYYENGATTIAQISRRYAPPSSTWAWKVKYFMRKIDSFPLDFSLDG